MRVISKKKKISISDLSALNELLKSGFALKSAFSLYYLNNINFVKNKF